MPPFSFVGEESSQFTRFARACLDAGLKEIRVAISGREPLTSRPVPIEGVLQSATVDGYIRFISVLEDNSPLPFNIGGSNATRSIAANQVRFNLSDDETIRLRQWGEAEHRYIPRLSISTVEGKDKYDACEAALKTASPASVHKVLEFLGDELPSIRTEAALTLRALSTTINDHPALQLEVESKLIEFSSREDHRDARVAAIEDLGYIGDERSSVFLARFAQEMACEQSCWAAAIALSRLQGADDVLSPLIKMVDNPSRWVRSAALLSLARRADRDSREKLEPVFARFLFPTEDEQLRIYACLGLNRFREFESVTWERLVAAISDDQASIGTKGYAALAIVGAFQKCPEDVRRTVANVIATLPRPGDIGVGTIDTVWGFEFLAELASVCAQPKVAARLYHRLATSFHDWRAKYYKAIKAYELGEAEAVSGDGDDAMVIFEEGIRELNFQIDELPQETIATIDFRRSIISARLRLQACFREWLNATDIEHLAGVRAALVEIRRSYQTYSTPDAHIGGDRQLVQRERDYLRNTVDLLRVAESLVVIDEKGRGPFPSADGMSEFAHLVQLAEESVTKLLDNLDRSYNSQMHALCSEVLERLQVLSATLVSARSLPTGDQMRLLRAKVAEIRAVFWSSSWPMPGRACPIYGLGRALLGVRQNGYSGSGAAHDPYVFEVGSKPIFPLFVKVLEMVTGGNARLSVTHTVAGRSNSREVPVVEGDFPIPIDLQECPTNTPFTIEVRAEFVSRDCTQVAKDNVYFLVKR